MFHHGNNPISFSSVKLTKKCFLLEWILQNKVGHFMIFTQQETESWGCGGGGGVGGNGGVSLLSGLTNTRQIYRYFKESTT